jgi:hypothetical protein
MVSGEQFAGTVTGQVTGSKVTINVTVTQPIGTMMTLKDATINGGTISGPFSITSPITANGSFTITKK